MAVEDHGLESLRKSAEEVTPGDKSNQFIKVANKDSTKMLTDAELRAAPVSTTLAPPAIGTTTVHIDVQGIATQTAFMLIDLSDTTNWKHVETGHINLEYLIIEVDPDSTFSGEIKFGFLSAVDATDGDFNQILDIDLVRKSDLLIEMVSFGSHGIDLKTSNHFGPVMANEVLFQTDVNLLGPDGATIYPSGAGDFAMLIEVSAGTVDVSVTIGYEGIA